MQGHYLVYVKCGVGDKVPKRSMENLGIAAMKRQSGLICMPKSGRLYSGDSYFLSFALIDMADLLI